MIMSLKTACDWDGVAEIVVDHFPFILGRNGPSDRSLNFAFVSRQHCQFTLVEDQVHVQDLESHNGTYLNGHRLSQVSPVRDGDEVSVGPLCFRVSMVAAAGETTPEFSLESTSPLPVLKELIASSQRECNTAEPGASATGATVA